MSDKRVDVGDSNALEVGDVVRLRSGGPWMTVEATNGDRVQCVWFHEHDVFRSSFPVDSLSLKEDGTPPRIIRRSIG